MPSLRHIDRLIEILAVLRTPGQGCGWDLKQTHATLAPYALEEAYEVVDAIERGDTDDLRDELGDYLLQVVFHARIAEEAGRFDFGDVVAAVASKMVRRHPHVFPPAEPAALAGGIAAGSGSHGGAVPHAAAGAALRPGDEPDWEGIKTEERARRRRADEPRGTLAGVPAALPALTRSVKLQARASTVGFDWADARPVLAKIREEVDEVEQELAVDRGEGGSTEALRDEIGDLFFAVANLARHAGIDPESAVRAANGKFERRFAFIERALAARGSSPRQATLADMEALWRDAKREEVRGEAAEARDRGGHR